MEQKRVQTLEALENFIQTHKTLLERTYTDIERLKALRAQVADGSVPSLQELTAKLDEPSFKLSEQLDAMPPLPDALDWSVFPSADATPFSTMATAAREAHAARSVPPTAQLSAPSALRQLVAAHRAAILDPVLSAFRLPDDLAALSSDEEADPEELRRAQEREKIRELKKRRIEGDAALAVLALGLRKPVAGVFIRRDQEDESAEVEISMADEESARSGPGAGSSVPMAVDTPATSVASLPPVILVERGASTRERRASRKAQENAKNEAAAAIAKAKAKVKAKAKTQAKPKAEPEENEEGPAAPAPEEPPLGKNGKAKSETYKQAWSVSEQHLLERLLEEIPDGEKNRWLKISKAMNGRRTARQVASRVQKYYEKLKRFGIEVAPGGNKLGASASAS